MVLPAQLCGNIGQWCQIGQEFSRNCSILNKYEDFRVTLIASSKEVLSACSTGTEVGCFVVISITWLIEMMEVMQDIGRILRPVDLESVSDYDDRDRNRMC